jgi:glycosyltransferase involved in cell wall biosynthesis
MACKADLLFLTLPARPDGSLGGRISAKTYEYLMTDRPILAAVPKGENWDYLEGKPGVWLVEPTDVAGMAKAITQLAAAKLSGKPLSFNRSELHEQLSYSTRAEEFDKILTKVSIGR